MLLLTAELARVTKKRNSYTVASLRFESSGQPSAKHTESHNVSVCTKANTAPTITNMPYFTRDFTWGSSLRMPAIYINIGRASVDVEQYRI